MSVALKVIKGGDISAEVTEVAVKLLSEHSKLAEYSPPMSKKKWREFIANVAKEGILQPITVTKGFQVVGGEYYFKAAKELGINTVEVIIKDIPENEIPSYMTNVKLQQAEFKKGQIAALVIRLFYEELAQEAKENQGTRTDITPDLGQGFGGKSATAKALAEKAGIGRSSMEYLIAVFKKRPDLFERVFNGEISINKAYTQMKADEAPEEVPQEEPLAADAKAVIERAIREEHMNPQIDESQPAHAPHNRIVQMRKKALSLTAEIIDEAETIKKVDDKVKESARKQLMSLTKSCVIALGQTADKDEDAEMLLLCLELLDKINGGNE